MELKKPSIMTQIMIAVVLGIIVGIIFPRIGPNIKVIGDIFLRLMQMAIPLLILGQIIQAVGGVDPRELSSLGGKTIATFGISSLLAAIWGIIMALVFQPGAGVNVKGMTDATIEPQSVSISETLLNFFPKNLFESLSGGVIIQIIVFALFFGVALNLFLQDNPNSHMLPLILDFNEIVIMIIRYVMKVAPIGIFALITSTISNLGIQIILPLLKYLLVYGIGTILFMGIWLLIIALTCRLNPILLVKNMKDMSVMALATTSSAITLPVALEETRTKIGLDGKITNLVLSLGMSLNSNGSAMHMAITVVTISQMYQIPFSIQMLATLAIVATFVSLANAVVPGAGLVSLAIIVPQMGLPIESIAIFAGVEWFVGMLRTILNVNSDVYSAIIVARTVKGGIDYDVFNGRKNAE